jgi:hypothetical protein
MKSKTEIKEKILKIKEILKSAELSRKSDKILTFSDYRGYHREIKVLKWVLD